MSENLEVNQVEASVENPEVLLKESENLKTQNVESTEVCIEKDVSSDTNQKSDSGQEKINNEDFSIEQIKGIVNILKDFVDKKRASIDEINNKREYLEANLSKYDSENYFQNDSFKTLYANVFEKLGTNLDTGKFISLVDDYVNSRIEAFSKMKSAENENRSLTESFEFQSGKSPKTDRKLRMQDIPENELEKYIAKYI